MKTKMQTSVTRKTILLSILLLVTGAAWAEWEKVTTTAQATFYIDRATIRKDGNLRRIWWLTDYKQRDTSGAMSVRQMDEYDCKGERRRQLSSSEHAEPMTGGKELASNGENPRGWRQIPPGTIGESLLKMLCAQ